MLRAGPPTEMLARDGTLREKMSGIMSMYVSIDVGSVEFLV
jgi:hypothetical protein